jgi:hypothetical protein
MKDLWKKTRFWLLDFDKKQTLLGLAPILIFIFIGFLMFLVIAFKFRNAIWNKIIGN